MKTLFYSTLLGLLHVATSASAGTITFVDGTTTEAEILFKHPNAPVLVARSAKNSSVQSFPIAEVAQATVGGKPALFSARRALTAEEKKARERNSMWVDDATPKQLGKYATEKWDRKPLIVWAKPGESGDGMQAASWLDEKGQPLAAPPWKAGGGKDVHGKEDAKAGSFEGDILLPAADTEYKAIQPGNRDHLGAFTIRHLTVERNASYNIGYRIQGNLWMKDGSQIGDKTQIGGLGSDETNKHTVARFSNFPLTREPAWAYAHEISHWVAINTGSGSLEIIGCSGGAGDRLTLQKGTLVMSEDSFIGNGNRGSFYTQEGTTAILLDGARVGCPEPLVSGDKGTVGISGTLLFGTPEHPLKRDLPFEACFFAVEKINPKAVPSQRTSGASFVLGTTGKMVVHSSDPAKARVVFCPRSKQLPVSQYNLPPEARALKLTQGTKDGTRKVGLPPKEELWSQPGIPKGVSAVLLGETNFNGVVFEGFSKEGIVVSPAARQRWKNVSFGPTNLGKPDELFKAP